VEDEKRSIEDIISDWKYACGQEKTSDHGTTYVVVPIADRRGNFLDLIQTLVDEGVAQEEIASGSISTNVVLTCWSNLVTKMTAKELKRARNITRSQWQEAIKEFFARPISEYAGPERAIAPTPKEQKPAKKELTKEELMEEIFDPKDRIVSTVIDRSNDMNWELLAELGIEPDGSEK
jgi:hypothetical protein